MLATMDAFEDDNPFAQDAAQSSNSSDDHVTVSIPSSPNAPTPAPQRDGSYLSPTSPTRPPFPSPGTGGFARQQGKDDYCCYRDQWLHSGDDAEVLVCCVCRCFV